LNPKGGKGPSSSGEDPYRRSAVDTLVEIVHNKPGDDRCVIMLCYREPMEQLFNDANPGLKRRMGRNDPIVFDDFSAEELNSIFASTLRSRSWSVDQKVCLAVCRDGSSVLT